MQLQHAALLQGCVQVLAPNLTLNTTRCERAPCGNYVLWQHCGCSPITIDCGAKVAHFNYGLLLPPQLRLLKWRTYSSRSA